MSKFLENTFHSLQSSLGVTLLGIQTLTAGATSIFFRFVISFKNEMLFTDTKLACLKYAPYSTSRMALRPSCHVTTRVIDAQPQGSRRETNDLSLRLATAQGS